jgi:histidine phosphotransfer protein HptB
MDFKDLASNLGFDEEDFNELIEIFTATSFSDVEKINSGLEENNTANVSQAAHSIKGAAGNLGFQKIASLSKDIEMTAKAGNIQGVKEKVSTIVQELKKIESAMETN